MYLGNFKNYTKKLLLYYYIIKMLKLSLSFLAFGSTRHNVISAKVVIIGNQAKSTTNIILADNSD